MRFRNILVGVDFRPGGRDAIALASQLLDPDGTMTLVHAHRGRQLPSHAVSPGTVDEERERAQTQLAQERADAGVRAELLLAEGPTAGQVLHEEAEERGADLLVLGSCHRAVMGRAMLGDNTRGSINGAPCAVAIAPAGYALSPKPLTSIGVGYDGSPESEEALGLARRLAASTGAKVTAVQVVSLPAYAYGGFATAMAMGMDEAVARADAEMKALEGVEGRAQYGLAADDLATFGKDVDLLVVGSRGYGPWGRLVHGSTANELARHAGGALLIVPRPSRAQAERSAGATGGSATVHA